MFNNLVAEMEACRQLLIRTYMHAVFVATCTCSDLKIMRVLNPLEASGPVTSCSSARNALFKSSEFLALAGSRNVVMYILVTSYGGGFAALWRYRDRSSPAQLPGIPYPWLSSAWRVRKVGHTSRYDIKSWQPFPWARTYQDNLLTSMT